MGNWGSANRTVPWAGKVGASDAPDLKAWTQFNKSFGGAVGALLGGWIASQFGRRSAYFAISLVSLCISYYIFRFSNPRDPLFPYLGKPSAMGDSPPDGFRPSRARGYSAAGVVWWYSK